MPQTWKTWELFLNIEFFINTFMGKSVMLMFVGFHLSNIIYEVFWFTEQFKFFGINQVSEFILYLNHKFNHIETVKTMVLEFAL